MNETNLCRAPVSSVKSIVIAILLSLVCPASNAGDRPNMLFIIVPDRHSRHDCPGMLGDGGFGQFTCS